MPEERTGYLGGFSPEAQLEQAERARKFLGYTQQKGRPMTYGTGVKQEAKPKRKPKAKS